MIGLFKPKAVEPVRIVANIEIDAPLEIVFDLVDFASPSNALRERGFAFAQNLFSIGRFCATNPEAPGVMYHFDVDQFAANEAVGFRSWLAGDKSASAVLESRSDYRFVGLGEERCRLELVETATLKPGASRKVRERELAIMQAAVDDHMLRLKLHAEYGAEATVAA